MNTKTAILLALLVVIVSFLAGMCTDHKYFSPCNDKPVIDTTTIRDTVYIEGGDPTVKIPDGFELVPVGTAKALANLEGELDKYIDSLRQKPSIITVHDTTYMVIPKSDYTFSDGKTYEMAVNGYDVTLLWHKSFQETKYITNTITKYKDYAFTLYPQFDAFYFNGIMGASASLAADISLSRDHRLKLTPEAGYAIVRMGGETTKGYYGKATLRYDLIRIK